MVRIFKLFGIAVGIAVLAALYMMMISFLKHSKMDPSEYTETDNNTGANTPSYIDYLSNSYEEPKLSEVHMPEPSKAKKKNTVSAPGHATLLEEEPEGDVHTRTMLSAAELKKKRGLGNEKLPQEFQDDLTHIQGVSKRKNGSLSYGKTSSRRKIVAELKKRKYEVKVDSNGNIIGWMGSYRVTIKHRP